jgi:hypothetical protein
MNEARNRSTAVSSRAKTLVTVKNEDVPVDVKIALYNEQDSIGNPILKTEEIEDSKRQLHSLLRSSNTSPSAQADKQKQGEKTKLLRKCVERRLLKLKFVSGTIQ